MPDQNNNIFFTMENLAFSMPLILVCSTYVYFKYVPLQYAIPILIAIFLVIQIRSMMRKQRDKKLETLDEKTIRDLVGDDDEPASDDKENAAIQKAKHRVQARLAQERKAANRRKGKTDEDDDDAATDLSTFAKSSSRKGKK